MKISAAHEPGKILVDCLTCGNMYQIDDYRLNRETADAMRDLLEKFRRCPSCLDAAEAKRKAEAKRQQRIELPDTLAAAGVPRNYIYDRTSGELLTKPPVRFVAEWVYNRRCCNFLLSGKTGMGKTTSAIVGAQQRILEGATIAYTTHRELLTKWRNAKKAEYDQTERMLRALRQTDLLIIDEVVGKAKITESGREFLFELLEQVNNGRFRSRVWLLGNFYKGSLEELFEDPEPARRRLQENFKIGIIDSEAKTVREVNLWP